MNKRKEKLTIEEKCNILKALNDGTRPKEICKQHCLNKCTVSRIKNNKETIESILKKIIQSPKNIKRISKVKVPIISGS